MLWYKLVIVEPCNEKMQEKCERVGSVDLSEDAKNQQQKPQPLNEIYGNAGTRMSHCQYQRIWKKRNPDKIKEYSKRHRSSALKWLRNNPEKRKRIALDYYYRHRPPLKVRILKDTATAIKHRRLRKTSISFCIADRLRVSLTRALRRNWIKKSHRTMELVGCSVEELKYHLESQFSNGMTWENRHSWHVDHIVPLKAFDLTSIEEQKIAFNYRNLRPLNRRENQKKQAAVILPLPLWIPENIAAKILARI